MRYIDDMLKMIPLDEMGGNDMKDSRMNISDNASENNEDPRQAEIKVRRGTAGVIAAALAVSIGAGAAALAKFGGSKAEKDTKAPGAAQTQTITDTDLKEADAMAKQAYNSVYAYCACMVADGYASELPKGEFTFKPSEVGDDSPAAVFFKPRQAEWVGEGEPDYSYTPNMPESGELYVVINETLMPVFVQWRADEGGTVGQYVNTEYCEDTRTAFGTAPKLIKTSNFIELPEALSAESQPIAFELCTVLNDMTSNVDLEEYPDNMEWFLLPNITVMLDFDKRDSYADIICRIEQAAGKSFTGQAYVNIDTGSGICGFVEWRENKESEMQFWPAYEDETAKFGEPLMSKGIDIRYYAAGDLANPDAANEIGCACIFPRADGLYSGVIAERSEIPEVEEWYEDFLARNYEPIAFDPEKKTAAYEIEKVIEYDFMDMNRGESVYIRTSDMEGANIYVNGRYYDVEDTSVLDLLDNGLPKAIDQSSSRSGDSA